MDDAGLGGLSARVRWARSQRGLSAQQVADASDVHLVTVQRIEAGAGDKQRIATPRRLTVAALARALGVDPGWLRTGDGEPGGGLTVPTRRAPAAE